MLPHCIGLALPLLPYVGLIKRGQKSEASGNLAILWHYCTNVAQT